MTNLHLLLSSICSAVAHLYAITAAPRNTPWTSFREAGLWVKAPVDCRPVGENYWPTTQNQIVHPFLTPPVVYGAGIASLLLNHGWPRAVLGSPSCALRFVSNLDQGVIFSAALFDSIIAWKELNPTRCAILLGFQYGAIRCFTHAKALSGRYYSIGSDKGSKVVAIGFHVGSHILLVTVHHMAVLRG